MLRYGLVKPGGAVLCYDLRIAGRVHPGANRGAWPTGTWNTTWFVFNYFLDSRHAWYPARVGAGVRNMSRIETQCAMPNEGW